MDDITSPPPPRAPLDWEEIERQYRAGALSIAAIGRQHGVSHVTILRKAKARGWLRDLSAQVRQVATATLLQPEVQTCSTREAIDGAAAQIVRVVREHRKDISAARGIVSSLMSELQATCADPVAVESAIAAEADPRSRDRMLRAVALPSRADTVVKLTTALKSVIAMEREAFSIEGAPDRPPDLAGISIETMTSMQLDVITAHLRMRIAEIKGR